MDLLIVHNRFFHHSGPETYLFNLISALEEYNINYGVFALRYDNNMYDETSSEWPTPVFQDYSYNNKNIFEKFVAGKKAIYDRDVAERFENFIIKRKPKKILFLQFSLRLSNAVISIAEQCEIPYYIRVSDFGYTCIRGTFSRNNNTCFECSRSQLPAIKHNCGNNVLKSVLLTANNIHFRRVLGKSFRGFIVPSLSTITRYKDTKLGKYTFYHVPSMILDEKIGINNNNRLDRAAYFGRISEDKTISDRIIKTFLKSGIKLDLYGRLAGGQSARPALLELYQGMVDSGEVVRLMSTYKVIVFFANWLDNLPNSLIEALSSGCFIVAPNRGSYKEFLENKSFAFLYDDDNEVADAVIAGIKNYSEIVGEEAALYAKETFGLKVHMKHLKKYGVV